MANAIVKINRRAKQLQSSHKNWTWQQCIKHASAEYRGEKKPARTAQPKKKPAKKIAQKKSKPVAHRKTNTVSHHVSVAKKLLVEDIAAAEARKFTMHKKSDKRKQGKKITELKRKYRKLC